MIKTTIDRYRLWCLTYGILSLLYTLKHFESIEEYEECAKIIAAIKENEKRLDTELFTEITQENIQKVISGFKDFGLTGKFAVESSIYYSTLILDEIKNSFTK